MPPDIIGHCRMSKPTLSYIILRKRNYRREATFEIAVYCHRSQNLIKKMQNEYVVNIDPVHLSRAEIPDVIEDA